MRASLIRLSAAAAASRRNTIGFIGLGAMGREMASNLLTKTFAANPASNNTDPVAFVVCDAFSDPVTNFLASHASTHSNRQIMTASSPAGVARLSSTLITMLPSSPQVKEAYLDPETGILASLKELSDEEQSKTLCIDCTTLDQAVAKNVASQVQASGAMMIDAPVSGDAFDHAEKYLALMGRRAIHCGDSGNGLAAKIANNLLLAISMIGTAEAMLLGQRLGLAPDLLAGILNTSTGKCWSSEINNPVPNALRGTGNSPPADRNWEGGFLSKLMSKDLGLATAAAGNAELALPLANIAERIYQKLAEGEDFANRDFSVVYEWLDRGNQGLKHDPSAREALAQAKGKGK